MPLLGYAAATQAVWTNAGANPGWFSDTGNWQGGVIPTSGSYHLVLNQNAAAAAYEADLIFFDMGLPFTAVGVTVNANQAVPVLNSGGETLTIGAEGLTMGANSSVDFQIAVLSYTTQTWNLAANSALTLSTALELVSGEVTVNLGSGATVNLNMSTPIATWGGTINFTGEITESSISVTGTALTAQNLGQITINGMAVTIDGGSLVAIPEPATYAGLLALAALAFVVHRRRIAA